MQNIDAVGYKVIVTKATTPNFKSLIARGDPLPDLPYSLRVDRYNQPSLRNNIVYANGQVQDLGSSSMTLFNNTGWGESDRALQEAKWVSVLNNKVLEKIKGQSLPVIQLYVERKKTASALLRLIDDSLFIARNVKRPARVFKHFGASINTRKYRKVRNSVKLIASRRDETVGSAWLKYRMFLLPTYRDVMSSLAAAADYEKKIHTSSVKASAKFNENLDFRNDTFSLLIPTNSKKGTISVTGGCTMKIRYSITDQSLAAVTSLADPLAVSWDLVPWSFIVDRFIDLGSYLELRNATVGTTFRSGCLSYLFEWNAKAHGSWVQTYYPNKLTWKLNGYKHEFYGADDLFFTELSTKRTVLTSFPPVQLEFPFRQGWKQITDEIVLLRQLLGRRLR